MVDTIRELGAEELASVAGSGFGSIGSSVAKTAVGAKVAELATEVWWYEGMLAGAWTFT